MFSNNLPYNKERKLELANTGKISCGFCRYHRGENVGRKERTNKYKNINRASIRFMDFET